MVKRTNDSDGILPGTQVAKTWTTSGKCGLLGLLISVVFTFVAFATPNWIEGDPRIYGTKMERVGLWVHCFRSLPDFNDVTHQRFFAGCRWIFDPFTEGYSDLRYYLSPRKFNLEKTLNFVVDFVVKINARLFFCVKQPS
jgi:hypothetical protein